MLLALGGSIALAGRVAPANDLRRPEGPSTERAAPSLPAPEPTRLGINLFGLATFNRQQVFSNLILQSEWFSSSGEGWSAFPAAQLDAQGWVRFLEPGQTAPRPIVLPPAPFRRVAVRCGYEGRGRIEAGGVARIGERMDHGFMMDLAPTGGEDEGAWIELVETDPSDPVRRIDCRLADRPDNERFSPEFLSFTKQFRIIRFLDWQRTNDNGVARWSERTLPQSATQVGPAGASIEDMVDLANQSGADPWFLMPYQADAAYVRAFARLVHDRIDPARTVHVELGNEVWNSMFDAARQARREGVALGLGNGDPMRAQMLRYARKVREAMQIWTDVFSDRRERLVRVAATQNAWPELATIILEDGDTLRWIDAIATAPYIWVKLDGIGVRDIDQVFAMGPAAIDASLGDALKHRALAVRHGKAYLAYEGGQHFVTPDLELARKLQRDPRMTDLYKNYLTQWESRIGGDMVLYASTAPIGSYGAWGLQEYAGQPLDQAPKMLAVQRFLAARR
ncbi:hypothetical protein DM806_09235 [Sphingobium lactosutens]|uniref:hypothetical protein n=1 Tax=Sphingobium lactosutens TaxID=522773 RepID=UPI0015BA1A30|nr:hypothetical protein [Sphingobium lactosutens]NWK95857.1 hypothetical protein [Sphingobium lactosutens]